MPPLKVASACSGMSWTMMPTGNSLPSGLPSSCWQACAIWIGRSASKGSTTTRFHKPFVPTAIKPTPGGKIGLFYALIVTSGHEENMSHFRYISQGERFCQEASSTHAAITMTRPGDRCPSPGV
uniref:Uncharacterized protein n=1 Tax=Magnetococcus massalia (strain MO-1) TaxID=451514 RepID=A0A1S7LJ81_MAGMO|nr:protein of unknown function [Candidatus Magnetococcus massalia]